MTKQLTFQLDPATVLWALGNPEGWLFDNSSRRTPCVTGYRVLEIDGQIVSYQQVWASLEYNTLDDLKAALAEAQATGNKLATDGYVARTTPGAHHWCLRGTAVFLESAKDTPEYREAFRLREQCRWATPAEVIHLDQRKALPFPSSPTTPLPTVRYYHDGAGSNTCLIVPAGIGIEFIQEGD